MIGLMKTDVLGRVIINAPLQPEQQGKKKPVLQPPQNHIVYTWERKKNPTWSVVQVKILFYLYCGIKKKHLY